MSGLVLCFCENLWTRPAIIKMTEHMCAHSKNIIFGYFKNQLETNPIH